MKTFQNITRRIGFCAVLACTGLQTPLQAKITLPAFFTDNMIIQQQTTMTLFGKAKPNKKVSIETSWNNQHYETKADAQGNWQVAVSTPTAGGPYRITLSDGKKTVLENVMAGEVWFCSGQSNMEMPVAGWGKIKNYEQEIAAADYPGIRLFQVKKRTSVAPLDAYQVESTMGGWKECSPSTVPEFSAVAYLYARELHQKLNVPVGVIDCTWGGTPAEAWTSSESHKQVMGYQKKVGKLEALGFDRDKIMAEYGKEQASWKAEISKIDKGYQNGKACWIGENVDDNDWQQMELPGYWEGKGLLNFDGVVWFRKQIEVPADWAGKDLQLNPGTIDDEDIVYWNGEQIASGAGYNVQRHYTVPARLVKAGRNTLAIKVSDNGGEGGIAGKAEDMNLKLSDQASLSLAGSWKYRVGCSLADMPPAPIYPEHSSFPSVLFNGMVHPCLEYPVKGIIWYQGCNNVGRAEEYESLFQTLITDWRKQFGQPDMPFYFVQLANYLDRKLVQADSPWAALREAQSKSTTSGSHRYGRQYRHRRSTRHPPEEQARSGTPFGRHLTGRYLRTENTRPSTGIRQLYGRKRQGTHFVHHPRYRRTLRTKQRHQRLHHCRARPCVLPRRSLYGRRRSGGLLTLCQSAGSRPLRMGRQSGVYPAYTDQPAGSAFPYRQLVNHHSTINKSYSL